MCKNHASSLSLLMNEMCVGGVNHKFRFEEHRRASHVLRNADDDEGGDKDEDDDDDDDG